MVLSSVPLAIGVVAMAGSTVSAQTAGNEVISSAALPNAARDEKPYTKMLPVPQTASQSSGSQNASSSPGSQSSQPQTTQPVNSPFQNDGSQDNLTESDSIPVPDAEPQTGAKKEKITVFEDAVGDEDDAFPDGEATLDVSIVVPHNKKSTAQLYIYPWPVKPPHVDSFPQPLPEREELIKQSLLSSGYVNRTSPDWPYPPGGWRWQHAYFAAKRKSGMTLPHSIIEHYSWVKKMMPYMKPEIIESNRHEEKRIKAYMDAQTTYKDDFTKIRSEALRRGLEPIELPRNERYVAKIGRHYKVKLKAGKWWIAGSHNCPGLKYYWWYPVTVKGNQDTRVVLNEANAIYIKGGW